jgi:hypothetical protein
VGREIPFEDDKQEKQRQQQKREEVYIPTHRDDAAMDGAPDLL